MKRKDHNAGKHPRRAGLGAAPGGTIRAGGTAGPSRRHAELSGSGDVVKIYCPFSACSSG